MGEGKDKSASKVEAAKQEKSPPGAEGAKQAGDQAKPPADSDAKEELKSSKAMKNQFALNRLVLMLMDVDPAALAQDMIDDLVKVHRLLDSVLKRQSADGKEVPAKGPE